MRVLFISGAEMPDYQCDMLFHGLREELGDQVVDVNRIWYMYSKDIERNLTIKPNLYGRGFTIYGLLDNDTSVDRSEIESKIASKYFDIVVYGSIRRCESFIDEVIDAYAPSKIAFVDGEDDQYVMGHLLGRGIYFKRELCFESRFAKPIGFAIPAVKIGTVVPQKKKIDAFIDPRDRSTYIYTTENEYYADYAQSLFGFTQKKAGWDCLRHYEIIANSCIPIFDRIEQCPAMTMVFLPKYELLRARTLLEDKGRAFFDTQAGRSRWQALQRSIHDVLLRHLTTVSLARYVLNVMRNPTLPAALSFNQ